MKRFKKGKLSIKERRERNLKELRQYKVIQKSKMENLSGGCGAVGTAVRASQ